MGDSMSDREVRYYPYYCLPSSELRGKRVEHDEGYCGRPILRKSKEDLPIQGSPCPHCSRRTRLNKSNLAMPESSPSGMPLRNKHDELMKSKGYMKELHQNRLHEWKQQQNQTHKSIFSNVSEETVEKIEQFAESFEQFVKEEEE
jgi:hypothetical protein